VLSRALAFSSLAARAALASLVLCCMTRAASAHVTGSLPGGFSSGFEHPLLGFDHLLAMLAVGVWGAQIGGRSLWMLPVAFPLMMVVGGMIGISGMAIPHIELGIALSVLCLGLAIAFNWHPLEVISIGLIGIFALCHGYAHGVELPNAADPRAYAIGFVLATGLIHLSGIGIGSLSNIVGQGFLSRFIGMTIALAGIYFIVV
jgi:urease accessory protein